MTVSVQTPYNLATGNGVTTVFPFQFKILASTDLQVYVAGLLKALGTDYTVSGVGVDAGGSVTFISGAPAALSSVSIIRAMAVRRTTDYQQLGDFLTPVVNPDFDNAILLIQDAQTQLGRSIRTPADEVGTIPTLPSIANRAGKYIAFDVNGLPVGSAGTGNDSALRTDLANGTTGPGADLVAIRRTAAEITAGVSPINYAKWASPWKDISRFVNDNTGATDVAAQFRNAIAAEKNIIIPEGTYRFDSEVVLPTKIRIEGAGRENSIIVLNAAAAAGSAALRTSAFAQSIALANFKVIAATDAKTHKCLRFAELRSSVIQSMWLEGSGSAAADQTAIQFDGTGTYTGGVDVFSNHITGTLLGIDGQLTCTTLRIRANEMYGRPGAIVATSRGIKLANLCAGVLVEGNTLQGWNRGVRSDGAFLRQVANYFEGNTAHWEWVRGAGNPRIWAESIGDQQISVATPIYPKNNVDNCVVVGLPETYFDNQIVGAGLGFSELLRTVALGLPTQIAFAAGDFTASGAMTWTVAGGNVVANGYKYSLIQSQMTIWFDIVGSTVGGAVSNRLFIKVPGGFSVKGPARDVSCTILNAGVTAAGYPNVLNGGTVIQIFLDAASATNFTAGTVDVRGQLTFEVQ